MSNGKCQENCQASYVFAIVQGQQCYCSNYIPADQVSTSECNDPCPGFPADLCGNTDLGLWGYLDLGGTPSGTAGASSAAASSSTVTSTPEPTPTPTPTPTPSSSSSVSTTVPTTTVTGISSSGRPRLSRTSSTPSASSVSVSVSVSVLTSYVSPQSSDEPSTSSSSSSTVSGTACPTLSSTSVRVDHSAGTHATWKMATLTSPALISSVPRIIANYILQSSSTSPPTSIEPTQIYTSVVTVTGRVSTIIMTPSSTSAETSVAPVKQTDSALGGETQQEASVGGGGLSGGTVAGIVVGVAVVIGAIIGGIVFLWLRRRHQKNLDAISEGGSHTEVQHSTKNAGGGIPSRQVSQMSSAGLLTKPTRTNTGRFSNTDDQRSNGNGTVASDRTSTQVTVDQRLNPWAIYSNEESRVSNVSLQDNQDYSRQLRVANPDP